jgi:hypothetical protein
MLAVNFADFDPEYPSPSPGREHINRAVATV